MLSQLKSLIPQSVINNAYHLPLAILANQLHGFPSRKVQVVGVTGTDGKTTTSTGIYHLLKTAGKDAALISTVKAIIKEQEYDTGFHVTTPSPWQLQTWIQQAAEQGVTHLVQESTSHGLDQHRLWGLDFDIGVITNITPEHLDYHKTYHNYLLAKAKLLRHVRVAILNADDRSFQPLLKYIKQYNPNSRIITYGINNSDAEINASKIKHTAPGISFLITKQNEQPSSINDTETQLAIKLPLLGNYNVANALAVAAVGHAYGLPPKIIQQSLNTFPAISGRMQIMHTTPNIVVDFAHTPNGLENALQTLREHYLECHPGLDPGSTEKKKGARKNTTNKNSQPRLISVFGAAGLRDHAKRPVMGEISGKLANITILTAEDPRTEDVNQIIDEIAAGCQKAGAQDFTSDIGNSKASSIPTQPHIFLRIPDRQQAITTAVQLANKKDVVGIFGKGHEQTMCFGTTEHPWSDQQAVNTALHKLEVK